MNDNALYLMMARLAEWLGFEVGVLEEKGSPEFTLVVDFPTGAVGRQFPAEALLGRWRMLRDFDLSKLPADQQEMDIRTLHIILGNLVQTIHTPEIEIKPK